MSKTFEECKFAGSFTIKGSVGAASTPAQSTFIVPTLDNAYVQYIKVTYVGIFSTDVTKCQGAISAKSSFIASADKTLISFSLAGLGVPEVYNWHAGQVIKVGSTISGQITLDFDATVDGEIDIVYTIGIDYFV